MAAQPRVLLRAGWTLKTRVEQLESDMDDSDGSIDKLRKSLDRLTGAVLAAVFTFGTSAVMLALNLVVHK